MVISHLSSVTGSGEVAVLREIVVVVVDVESG
jgi:hypothetical protein